MTESIGENVRAAAKAGAAAGVACWLFPYLQTVLTNELGAAWGMHLKFGVTVGLAFALLGGLVGALIGAIGGTLRLPDWVARGSAAALVFGVAWWQFLFPTPDAFKEYAAILSYDTGVALGMTIAVVILLTLTSRLPVPGWGRLAGLSLLALAISPLFQRDSYDSVGRLPEKELERQLLAGSGEGNPDDTVHTLLFAVDGLSWNVLQSLRDAGRVPNMDRVIKNGSYADLASVVPTLSPIIWNTIATGWRWHQHGVRDFQLPRPPGAPRPISVTGTPMNPFLRRTTPVWNKLKMHQRYPVSAHSRLRRAFWDVFEQAGVPCAMVSWFATDPAPDLTGGSASDQAFTINKPSTDASMFEFRVHPESLKEEAASVAADPAIKQRVDDFLGRLELKYPHERNVLEGRLYRAIHRVEMTKRVIHKLDAELTTVYTRLVDDCEHMFWIFHEPDSPAYEGIPIDDDQQRRLAPVIEMAYELTDELLGELLTAMEAKYGADKVAVMIVSDHGSHASRPVKKWLPPDEQTTIIFSGEHDDGPPGVFAFSGPGVPRDSKVTGIGIQDVVPILARYHDVPIAENLPGRAPDDLFFTQWLEAHPPRRVPTWEVEGVGRPGIANLPQMSAAQMQALEELGYAGY